MDKIEPVAIRKLISARLDHNKPGYYEDAAETADAVLELGAMLDERDALLSENARLREALEKAANGLRWYHAEYPERVCEADYEMLAEIDAALSAQEDA
jgi:hypothetical protein